MPTYLRAPLAITVYFFHSSLLSAVIKIWKLTFFNENIYTNKWQQQYLQNRKRQAGRAARHSPPSSEVNITFLKHIFNKIQNPTQGYSGARLRNVSKSFFKVPFYEQKQCSFPSCSGVIMCFASQLESQNNVFDPLWLPYITKRSNLQLQSRFVLHTIFTWKSINLRVEYFVLHYRSFWTRLHTNCPPKMSLSFSTEPKTFTHYMHAQSTLVLKQLVVL